MLGNTPVQKVYGGTQLIWSLGGGSQPTPTLGLISHYSFEEMDGLTIDSQSAQNGSPSSGVTRGYPGISNYTYKFSGSNGEIIIPDNDDHSMVDTNGDLPFTIRLWVKFDQVKDTWFVMRRGKSSSYCEYQLFYYQGNLGFSLFEDGRNISIGRNYSWSPVTGKWYHMVTTYDGSKNVAGIKIYLDAVRVDTVNANSATTYSGMVNTNTTTMLGSGSPWNSSLNIKGYIDELSIYKDYCWTDSEVLGDYNSPEFIKEKNDIVLYLDPHYIESYGGGSSIGDMSSVGGGVGSLYGIYAVLGGGLEFNSNGNSHIKYIRNDINSGSFSYDYITLNMWIKPHSGGDTVGNIFTIEDVLEVAYTTSNKLQYASNPWAWRTESTSSIIYDEWQMITYVHGTNYRKLLVNGAVVYTSSDSGALNSGGNSYPHLTLMGRYDGDSANPNCGLGLMELYSSELSDEKINIIYNQTKPRFETVAIVYETETIDFMTMINIDDNSSATAHSGVDGHGLWVIVDDYIKSLKTAGLWDKIVVDYIMVGGTEASTSRNLKDPTYLQVVWYNAWVFDGNGVMGNGTNTFGRIPISHQDMFPNDAFSNGATAAIGTNNTPIRGEAMDLGVFEGQNGRAGMALSGRVTALGDVPAGFCNKHGAYQTGTTVGEARGINTIQRTTLTHNELYRNGVIEQQSENANPSGTSNLSSHPLFIGGYNANYMDSDGSTGAVSYYTNGTSNQRIQSMVVHEGLTSSEVITLRDIINTKETALGRKTW